MLLNNAKFENMAIEEIESVPGNSYLYLTNLVGRSQSIDDISFTRGTQEDITDEWLEKKSKSLDTTLHAQTGI
jgi:hypothetical protein